MDIRQPLFPTGFPHGVTSLQRFYVHEAINVHTVPSIKRYRVTPLSRLIYTVRSFWLIHRRLSCPLTIQFQQHCHLGTSSWATIRYFLAFCIILSKLVVHRKARVCTADKHRGLINIFHLRNRCKTLGVQKYRISTSHHAFTKRSMKT